MKKTLLTTTAVAGVAFAGVAQAEAPTLTISGGMEYAYHFYDIDQTATGASQGPSLGHGIAQDSTASQIIFNAKGVADNGLEYGAVFDFRMNISNDESYIYVADSWGRLHFGDDDGVVANMTYGGEAALAGTGGFDGDYLDFVRTSNLGISAVTDPSTVGGTDDAGKIAYYSPNFAGFEFGASFTPERTFVGTTFKSDNPRRGLSGNTENYQNIIDVAATWDGNFDAVTIGLNAGYRTANAQSDTTTEDVSVFEVGGKVGFGGFTVAAAYGDNGDSLCATGAAGAGCDAGFYWDVGVGYAAGPFKVGAGYFVSEATAGTGVGDDEVEMWTIGGNYTIAQGLTAFAEYNDADLTNGTATGTPDTTTGVSSFILGTRISF